MTKKLTALTLSALLLLGLTACSSGNNVMRDTGNYDAPYSDNNDYGYGTDNTYGPGNTYGAEDDSDRYHDMLENGRIHDSDGYLLDGENRHD
ncbi:MAG: hypothetical protein E7426_08125 [Ruminococcaceae bacterium]|nr:hypothetical protein [Oscillospiraceae bacterium]